MQPQQPPESVVIQQRLTSIHIDRWVNEELFHWQWWILLALVVSALAAWWILLDKRRAREICVFAALALVFMLGLEEYGEELILWDYPVQLIPLFPPLTSVNLLLVPLSVSLAYQRTRSLKHYALAVLTISAVQCFAVEPLLALMGLYKLVNWHFAYSVPFYAAIGFLTRLLMRGILCLMEKNRYSYS